MNTKIIALVILLSGLLTACFEDKSNLEIEQVNPIVIDLGSYSTNVSAYLLDTLQINPVVYKRGTDDAQLSFKWEVNGNDIVRTEIANTMNLNAIVSVPVHSDPYKLILTVTDQTTGIQNFEEFQLYVLNNFGKGLLVADSKDGITSDLNLIMSLNFTASYMPFSEKNTKTMKEVYSLCNGGQRIDGLVKGMQSVSKYGSPVRTLTMLTDHSAVRVDPFDYLRGKENGEMFYVPVPSAQFLPRQIQFDGNSNYEFMNLNGTIYARRMGEDNEYYGAPLSASDYEDYEISQMCAFPMYSAYESVFYFDEKGKRFLYSDGAHEELTVISHASTSIFDPNNVGQKNALYMGIGGNNDIYTLFKSEGGSEYSLYTFVPKKLSSEFKQTNIFKLSKATTLSNAVSYECSPIEEVFYYATDKKVYAALLTQETPEVYERYSIPDDQPDVEITCVKLWRQSFQGKIRVKDSESETGYSEIYSANRMMMICTYNKITGEGRVICVPVMDPGSGTLEKDRTFHKEYDGFGRILYLAPQAV